MENEVHLARVEKSANQARVEQILKSSDIVWPKYCSKSWPESEIEDLAEEIVKALMGLEK